MRKGRAKNEGASARNRQGAFSFSTLPTAAKFARQCGFGGFRHKYALSRQRADTGADRGLDGAGTATAAIWQRKKFSGPLNAVGMASLPTAVKSALLCGSIRFWHKTPAKQGSRHRGGQGLIRGDSPVLCLSARVSGKHSTGSCTGASKTRSGCGYGNISCRNVCRRGAGGYWQSKKRNMQFRQQLLSCQSTRTFRGNPQTTFGAIGRNCWMRLPYAQMTAVCWKGFCYRRCP